ncbi:MAG: protein kinase, partial [Isosphaeraceae bacterium]
MGESVLPTLALQGPLPTVDLRDPGSVPPAPSDQPRANTGTRYDLLGEIARGGMGAVIRGRDNDLGRDLAVKVLLEQHRDRPDLLHRFIEEAQIGGQLQHPGVVPVYELGTFPDRRPYFTMKLVRGRTLSALLAERESLSSDLPRFLAVFEQVCQTMAYAHTRGVIHRDLKPANIMVGHFGEVQVMDWGLAKVLGRADTPIKPAPARPEGQVRTSRSNDTRFSELSEPGEAMGTPAYMAPEQAQGDTERLDERADVFGLGAVLCQILTSRPPYVGKNQAETTFKAARADLADAHARLDACAADPEVVEIARRCLAANRDDRPRDAGEVARALRAHRDGVQDRLKQAEIERVEAEARALGERKRRRLQAGLGLSVLALTVVGGLSLASWRQQQQARASRVALALNEVELLRNQAAESADDVASWEKAELAARRASLDLADADAPAAARLAALQREIGDAYQAARRDSVLLDELAEIRTSKEDLGLEGADHRYERAFQAAGADALRADADKAAAPIRSRPARVVVATAAGLDDWALVRSALGLKGSDWRKPLEVARRVDPDPFRNSLRAAVLEPDEQAGARALRALAADPKAAELPPASAVLLAQFLRSSGATEPAAGVLRLAVAAHPDDVWVNYVLASTLMDVRPARREEAVQYYTAARAVRPETAHELAHLLQAMGRPAEAAAVFQDLARRRPDNVRHLTCLGEHMIDHGKRAEGIEALRRAEQAARAGLKLRPDDTFLLNNLGNGLRIRGDLKGAEEVLRRLIRLKPDYALAHRNLGLTLNDLHDYQGAVAEGREAVRLDPKSAADYNGLGNALVEAGEVDQGIAALKKAIELLPEYAEAHTSLSYALDKKGQLAAALESARRAVALRPDLDIAR